MKTTIGLLFLLVAAEAGAQHATAFDVEEGSRAFASVCANCHGPDGNLIPDIDLGRGLFRRPLSDTELVDIILNGVPNTPMPPNPGMSQAQAERIVAYLRDMAASRLDVARTGDPANGRRVFAGKGGCMDCHRVNGSGSGLGPDLSRIGAMRRASELEASLLEPTAEVQASNRFYRVATANGRVVKGRLLNHDTFYVQMLDEDERLRTFAKAELREHGFDETPMPSFRDELSAQEIADVVSYLITLRGN